jgi:hypothetical protein
VASEAVQDAFAGVVRSGRGIHRQGDAEERDADVRVVESRRLNRLARHGRELAGHEERMSAASLRPRDVLRRSDGRPGIHRSHVSPSVLTRSFQ